MNRILFTAAMLFLSAGAFAQTATATSETKTTAEGVQVTTTEVNSVKGKSCCAASAEKSCCSKGAEASCHGKSGKAHQKKGQARKQNQEGVKNQSAD
jgi:hypothetical protein